MKILIPASEGKAKVSSSSEVRFEDTDFVYKKEVQQVVNLLELIDEEDLKSIYGTTDEKSILFHRLNQSIFKSKCVNAIERYTGVVYSNIGWKEMSNQAQSYMKKHILIFSGLFGMGQPVTPIPNYKLKMNVLSLQHHWRPILTNSLSKEKFIIDLLPQVHRKAYEPNQNTLRVAMMNSEGRQTLFRFSSRRNVLWKKNPVLIQLCCVRPTKSTVKNMDTRSFPITTWVRS